MREVGGTLDCAVGSEREECMKNGGVRQTSFPYIHVRLHQRNEPTSCTNIEMK